MHGNVRLSLALDTVERSAREHGLTADVIMTVVDIVTQRGLRMFTAGPHLTETYSQQNKQIGKNYFCNFPANKISLPERYENVIYMLR